MTFLYTCIYTQIYTYVYARKMHRWRIHTHRYTHVYEQMTYIHIRICSHLCAQTTSKRKCWQSRFSCVITLRATLLFVRYLCVRVYTCTIYIYTNYAGMCVYVCIHVWYMYTQTTLAELAFVRDSSGTCVCICIHLWHIHTCCNAVIRERCLCLCVYECTSQMHKMYNAGGVVLLSDCFKGHTIIR